jgi:hypothetical protein
MAVDANHRNGLWVDDARAGRSHAGRPAFVGERLRRVADEARFALRATCGIATG